MTPITPSTSPSQLARYLVVGQVRALVGRGVCVSEAVKLVAAELQEDGRGSVRQIGQRSIWRWLRAYDEHGFDGLADRRPEDQPASRVLSPGLVAFLREKKLSEEQPSIPEILRQARVKGIIGEKERIDRTSVWRTCRRLSLPTRKYASKQEKQRSWAYSNRMLCILADGKHFRAGRQRRKRVALIFIDDATRFILGSVVVTAEAGAPFLKALLEVIRRWGLMQTLFLDRGPGFICKDTKLVCGRLRINLVLGAKRYPEGHGLVERFNQTMLDQLLTGIDGNPDVDPSLASLSLRLKHWCEQVYNHQPHEGIGGLTPAARFHDDVRQLQLPDDMRAVEANFLASRERKVTNTNTIKWGGVHFELPLGYRRQRIEVARHVITGELSILHEGRRVVLKQVDLAANARDPRRGSSRPAKDKPPAAVNTAANIRFTKDHPPLVDDEGNCTVNNDD